MARREHVIPNASALSSWRKSSYSGPSGGDCLEVSDSYAPWRKSTYSDGTGGDCLEVGSGPASVVPVRDSKVPEGPAVLVGADAWGDFVGAVKDGGL